MAKSQNNGGRLAPIFIVADEDRQAATRLMAMLPSQWYFVPVSDPAQVVQYADQFATTAVFLADPTNYGRGGTARLLQDLLDQVGKPVVILTEDWNPEVRDRWKRMGAYECAPHPTRAGHRTQTLKDLVQQIVLASLTEQEVGQ